MEQTLKSFSWTCSVKGREQPPDFICQLPLASAEPSAWHRCHQGHDPYPDECCVGIPTIACTKGSLEGSAASLLLFGWWRHGQECVDLCVHINQRRFRRIYILMERDPMDHKIRAAPQPMGDAVERSPQVLVYSYPGARYRSDTCDIFVGWFSWVRGVVVHPSFPPRPYYGLGNAREASAYDEQYLQRAPLDLFRNTICSQELLMPSNLPPLCFL